MGARHSKRTLAVGRPQQGNYYSAARLARIGSKSKKKIRNKENSGKEMHVMEQDAIAALNKRQRMLLRRRARETASLWRLEQERLSSSTPLQQLQDHHQLHYHTASGFPSSPLAGSNAGHVSGTTWHYANTNLACEDPSQANGAHLDGYNDDEDSCCCGLSGNYEDIDGGATTTTTTATANNNNNHHHHHRHYRFHAGCQSHDCDFGYGSGYGLESCDCVIMGASLAASLNRVGGDGTSSGTGVGNGKPEANVNANAIVVPTHVNPTRRYYGRRRKAPKPRRQPSAAQPQNHNIVESSDRLESHSSSSAGPRRIRDTSYPIQSPPVQADYHHHHQENYPFPTNSKQLDRAQLHQHIIRTMNTATHLQRGLAYDEDQRKQQGLLGLLPPSQQSQELQAKAVINFIDNCCKDELSRYVYLRHLKDFNEHLFYYTLMQNVEKLMPLVYTPTVGLACQKFSHIYLRPRGMFISINDLGRVSQLLANWPEKDVRVIVVTDGERILGLGDLGANGMGISIGKLSLYTALAGIPPKNVLPICLDVGTNNESNLEDEFYIGLRQNRVRGEKYDLLVEEFMQAVVERWGRSCLIQFEDFANSTAFNLLQKYRDDYCTFNDDIQGTASVCLSGLISAAKQIGRKLSTCSFLFYGAGEANLGTAKLLMMAMMEDGSSKEEAKGRIWLVDSKGLVVVSREDLSGHKREFARDSSTPQIKDLESIIKHTKPTAIIGASAQAGAFNETICRLMAEFNQEPIIFALSNPTSKAECTAKQAYEWTDGRCVFASGSPFDPVEFNGRTFITGQGNNAYIFPGVGLAAIAAHTHTVPEETFLVAARALSDQLEHSDTKVGLVYPRLNRIREVTLKVATRVLEYFYSERLATFRPEPNDKLEFLKSIQYDTRYESA